MLPFRWSVIVCLLIFVSQSYSQGRKKPDWVTITPVDNFSYYGIGIAATDDTNYRDKARAIALKEISEKIFVSIDSESNLRLRSTDKDTRYYLNEDITTISAVKLEGYTKVADWQDSKEGLYYVLFKLNRDLYQSQRTEYINSVVEKIQFKQDRAQKFFQMNDYNSAITYLESALFAIEEEFNRFPEPDFANKLQTTQDEIIAYYEDRISRIRIIVESKDIKFDPLSEQQPVVYYKAVNRLTGENLSNFPVKIHVISGEVINYEIKDGLDSSKIHINGLIPYQGEALLRIQPDLSGKFLESNNLLSQLVNYAESSTFSISFVPYKVFFVPEQEGSSLNLRLQSFFSTFLEFCSIETTEDEEDAVYFLSIPSEMVSKSSSNGIITKIDSQIVARRKDGSVAFKTDFEEVMVIKRSLLASQKLAVETLMENAESPLQQMTHFFCSHKY